MQHVAKHSRRVAQGPYVGLQFCSVLPQLLRLLLQLSKLRCVPVALGAALCHRQQCWRRCCAAQTSIHRPRRQSRRRSPSVVLLSAPLFCDVGPNRPRAPPRRVQHGSGSDLRRQSRVLQAC